ncbi:MAG: MarR family transcriptional regulator [Catenulispora sp.]|nr:MarR family transcriptional regulator [Catenulispora sp.]
MHPTDLQCVALLDGAGGPISTGELARLSGLTPGSASRLVDRLEKAGLVERLADPQDRRKALVALVPAASERIGRAWEEPGTAYGEVLGRYSDAELDVIADYLRRAGAVGMAQAERLRAEA